MDEDMLAMRKASRKVPTTMCAACELESEMGPERREAFRRSYQDPTINTAGRLAWIREKYPDARVLELRSPSQCLRRHRDCADE